MRDHGGQVLPVANIEDKPDHHSAAKLLLRDEAQRIGANIAKLPGRSQLCNGEQTLATCKLSHLDQAVFKRRFRQLAKLPIRAF